MRIAIISCKFASYAIANEKFRILFTPLSEFENSSIMGNCRQMTNATDQFETSSKTERAGF